MSEKNYLQTKVSTTTTSTFEMTSSVFFQEIKKQKL